MKTKKANFILAFFILTLTIGSGQGWLVHNHHSIYIIEKTGEKGHFNYPNIQELNIEENTFIASFLFCPQPEINLTSKLFFPSFGISGNSAHTIWLPPEL